MLTVIPLCWWPVIVWYAKHYQGKKKDTKKTHTKNDSKKKKPSKSCLYLPNHRIPNVITTIYIFVSHNYHLWTDSMTNKSNALFPRSFSHILARRPPTRTPSRTGSLNLFPWPAAVGRVSDGNLCTRNIGDIIIHNSPRAAICHADRPEVSELRPFTRSSHTPRLAFPARFSKKKECRETMLGVCCSLALSELQ